jgi:hypothetical protein
MTDTFANSTGSLPLGRLDFYQDDFLDQSEGDPRGRIRRPAMVLLVLAALSMAIVLFGLVMTIREWMILHNPQYGVGAGFLVLVLLFHSLAIMGLISAITLRNYIWAWIGVGLSALPCGNALSILWLPLLISAWGVFSLLNPETRKAFRK